MLKAKSSKNFIIQDVQMSSFDFTTTLTSHDSLTQAALPICTATASHWRKKMVARVSREMVAMLFPISPRSFNVSAPRPPNVSTATGWKKQEGLRSLYFSCFLYSAAAEIDVLVLALWTSFTVFTLWHAIRYMFCDVSNFYHFDLFYYIIQPFIAFSEKENKWIFLLLFLPLRDLFVLRVFRGHKFCCFSGPRLPGLSRLSLNAA